VFKHFIKRIGLRFQAKTKDDVTQEGGVMSSRREGEEGGRKFPRPTRGLHVSTPIQKVPTIQFKQNSNNYHKWANNQGGG